jgi:hypothetical protein
VFVTWDVVALCQVLGSGWHGLPEISNLSVDGRQYPLRSMIAPPIPTTQYIEAHQMTTLKFTTHGRRIDQYGNDFVNVAGLEREETMSFNVSQVNGNQTSIERSAFFGSSSIPSLVGQMVELKGDHMGKSFRTPDGFGRPAHAWEHQAVRYR